MKDTQETNMSQDEVKVEETKNLVEAPEMETATDVETDVTGEEANLMDVSELSKDEIVDKLAALIESSAEGIRGDVEALKQAYYRLRHNEVEEQKRAFVADGGAEADFVAPEDETEGKVKALLTVYKEKKAALLAEEERVKAANYALKLQLLDQLKALSESQEDFNKLYSAFKDIQQRWKEIKLVPQEHANDLWRSYQAYSEHFYDLIKINNQFREYDFKKNLELKTALCEAVEKLATEPDVISAFHQLQKMHQQWREIGPVAKEIREELWARFKAASVVVNKRHQAHFEKIKEAEVVNLQEKTAICEEMEAIDFAALKTVKDWDAKSKEVIAAQEKWRTIGYAPKKHNQKIFDRFRKACDDFFEQKGNFFKVFKAETQKNLEAKRALCEQAEALKDSTDWKATSEKLIALQKEWKATGGPMNRKRIDALWKRFNAACDYFFDQKKKSLAPQKAAEENNLAAKKALIEQINQLDEQLELNEAIAQLKAYMTEWNQIGFVPLRDKDKVQKAYREALDKQFDRLKVDQNDRKIQAFRNNLTEMSNGEKGKNRLFNERDKLLRQYERMKNELQTYENNIGFLSISSKGGGGLLKDLERKIEGLKADMALIVKKIDAIDENLE
ncbi:MAG: DUF349 domain-containing protein [Parabacteroides sp.]